VGSRFLHIGSGKVVVELGKAARRSVPTPATSPVPSDHMTGFMAPREEVMKAAVEAVRKLSFAADQPSGGMPPGLGTGTPIASVPAVVTISVDGTATSTPSIPDVVTITVDDLRREGMSDTQDFTPSAVRAANDLAKARRNASRSRGFLNTIDLARDGEIADFIEEMETIFSGFGAR
jgi:hypothetical protein